MRILVATPFMSQHFDAGLFWVKALCNMGHSVFLWDYRVDGITPKEKKLDAQGSIVFKGENVDPRQLPRPVICYWPDDLERTPGIEEKLRKYDKVFTPVRPTPDWMEWLPSGWDPTVHGDLGLKFKDWDTTYVGTNNSPYKERIITSLLPSGLYGNLWEKGNPPVYLHQLVYTLNSGKVLIDVHQSPTVGLNRKFFEMIACGFTIVDRVPGVLEVLGELFGLNVTYTNVEEAKELIDFFLRNPEEREKAWEIEKEKILPYTYENCTRRLLEWLRYVG